jgi:hypothetical protein
MKETPKSVVIVPHKKDCFMKGQKIKFSGIPNGYFWGNFKANSNVNRGCYHLWIKTTCNDPNCPAIKAVHCNVLAKAE